MQRLEPAKCIAKAVLSCVVAWLLSFRAFQPQAVFNVRLRSPWVESSGLADRGPFTTSTHQRSRASTALRTTRDCPKDPKRLGAIPHAEHGEDG